VEIAKLMNKLSANIATNTWALLLLHEPRNVRITIMILELFRADIFGSASAFRFRTRICGQSIGPLLE
jgi:hypothetical protein